MSVDFSGQDLRGRSFKGQNLTGANFSYSNIRGANFTNAILHNASFKGSRAGLEYPKAIAWTIASGLLAFCSAFAANSTNVSWWNLVRTELGQLDVLHDNAVTLHYAIVFGAVMAIVLLLVCLISVRFGLGAGLNTLVAMLVGVGTLTAIGNTTSRSHELLYRWASSLALALMLMIVIPLILALAIVLSGTVARKKIGIGVALSAFAGGAIGAWVRVLIRGGGGLLVVNPISNWAWIDLIWGWIWAWLLSGLGSYLGWRALSDNAQLARIKQMAVAIAAINGTSFRQADLTSADFTQAILKNTDLRQAHLLRTCWYGARKLDLAHVGDSYLQHPQVRQLATTGQGADQCFDRLNLSGIYLKQAILTDASFIGADLNHAHLRQADLSRAKLKQTQLDGADLTAACLTGAYIEDWGITSETQLEDVHCQYIYMHIPTRDQPDPLRKPDNRKEIFEDGDFAQFIQPIVNTLDLYHNQGVDPRAIAISFKQLAEEHPDAELEIVATEKRGKDKLLLRAKTAPAANKSQLSAAYFATYNAYRSLSSREIRALLDEKDHRISRLEIMLETALQRPSFYAETHIQKVGTMSNNPNGIAQSNSGYITGGMQAAIGDHNAQTQAIHATTNAEQPLTQAEVMELLRQIEALIRQTELPPAIKEESLAYLGAAQKATAKEEPKKPLIAENLKSMAETLEGTSKTIAAGQSLWDTLKPMLMQLPGWLGVVQGFFI